MTRDDLRARLAARDGRYRALFAGEPQPAAPPPRRVALPVRPPCVHEGAVVERCTSCRAEEGHVRHCDHPTAEHDRCTRGANNGAVQSCATCPDHEAAGRPARTPRTVVVPQPPPLRLAPTSPVAVVTAAVGGHYRALLGVTGPYHAAFARRVGADLVVLDWPGHPDWPMSCKFGLAGVLDYYERVLWVDPDVLLRPGCVNPLEHCPADAVGAFDELGVHASQPRQHYLLEDYRRLRKAMGFDTANPPRHFNSGVVVVPRSAASCFGPPDRPVPVAHCAEQDCNNARVWAGGHKFVSLPAACNWQNWIDPTFKYAPADAVLHWSAGGSDRAKRLASIREWAKRFPVETPDGSDIPSWYGFEDVYDELVKRCPDGGRVVEVGSWLGRSVVHLARAARASGKRIAIAAVDTWEGTPHDEHQHAAYADVADRGDPYRAFLANLARCGVYDLVEPVRSDSVAAAGRFADGSLDAVFLDADHSQAAVSADVRAWLPKVRPGGVLAGHDYYEDGVGAAVDAAFGGRVRACGDPEWPCWWVDV